jgi:hypothetical protein
MLHRLVGQTVELLLNQEVAVEVMLTDQPLELEQVQQPVPGLELSLLPPVIT